MDAGRTRSRGSGSAGYNLCCCGARTGGSSIGQNLSALSGTAQEQMCGCRFGLRLGEMENSCYR